MAGQITPSAYTIPISPIENDKRNSPNGEVLQESTQSAESQEGTPLQETATPSAANESTPSANSLDPCLNENNENIICDTAGLEIGTIIGNLIQFIFVVAVILALGFLVFGGIKWLTSGGDKENVATARGTIIAAVIGLIIVFLSYVILNLVLTFLIGTDISEVEIPRITGGSN